MLFRRLGILVLANPVFWAMSVPDAQRYTFQLLGFKTPVASPYTGITFCELVVKLEDASVLKKHRRSISKEIRRQLTKYINADGRISINQSENCQPTTFVVKSITDYITFEKRDGYAAVRFEMDVMSGEQSRLAGINFTSRYNENSDIFDELDAFYILSVREKSDALSILISQLIRAKSEGLQGDVVRVNRVVSSDSEKAYAEPVQLYRDKAFYTLISKYTLWDVSDSYVRLDAYCSALLDLGEFSQFFACIEHWDKASFSVITGYQAYDNNNMLIPEHSIANQVKSLVLAPSPVSESLFKWEVAGRKHRLLCEAWFRLGNYAKSKQACDRALKLYRPRHQLWNAPSKRYLTSPGDEDAPAKGSAMKMYWSFPGGDNAHYWSADILLTSSLAAQSNIHLNGPSADNDTYFSYINSSHLNHGEYEFEEGLERLRVLFKNPVYFLAEQYDKIVYMSALPSGDADAAKAAGLQVLSAVANIAGFVAMFAGEEYEGVDENLFAIGDSSRDIANELLAPSYFDAVAYRESFQRASIHYQQGRYKDAVNEVRVVLNEEVSKREKELFWNALMLLGMCLYELNALPESLATFEQAMDVIEELKGNISVESQKIGFLTNKDQVYEHAMRVALAQQDYEQLLLISERARARALIDMMADTFDRRRYQTVSTTGQTYPPRSDAKTQDLLERDIQQKLRGLVRRKPKRQVTEKDALSTRSVSVPSVSELQALLGLEDVAIVYTKLVDGLGVIKVTHESISFHPIAADGLAETVGKYRLLLQDASNTQYLRTSQALYKRLIVPLELPKGKSLYIAKSGVLNYLPFASLHDGEKFLVEHHGIRNIPSLSTLAWIPTNSNARSLLAIGNPTGDLPGSEMEVKSIVDGYKSTTLLVGAQASINNFASLASEHSQIHFAMHGVYDSERVSQSRLLFAPPQRRSAQANPFYLGEVLNLTLNADLVVLSACETGLNKVSQGDEIMGFTRSFLQAGANNIVSSLWKVDDLGTFKLMTDFYKNMNSTSYHQALRNAQIDMLNSNYKHPFYWSAFTFTGSG